MIMNGDLPLTSTDLSALDFDDSGLIPVVVQDEDSKEVLMVAWTNADALAKTFETGRMHYWSRSRGELWEKGATSKNIQILRTIHVDCDGDTLLAVVKQTGSGACHKGAWSCFAKALQGMSSED